MKSTNVVMAGRKQASRVSRQSHQTNGKMRVKVKRRYLLKVTPIEAWDLVPSESGRSRNAYCTLVLLDENKREIKGEKQRTPPLRQANPVWSPLKAAVLRSLESHIESHQPLGIGAAAASEEYTFGIQTNLVKAKYVLVKCKDKGRVENEDLGRLLLSLEDMNTSGDERVAWYDLQLRPGGKMKRVQGKVRISSRIMREPSLWQLWTAAEQMRQELPGKDRSLYLKPHLNVITGKEAVEWMLCHGLNRPMQGGITCSTAEEALLLGTALLRNGVLMHVSGDRRFTNSTWKYYRFLVNHLDATVQKEAMRQRDLLLSGEAEEVEDMEEEVLTRTMMTMSVCNEEEHGLGASRVASGSTATPATNSTRGKSKSTLRIEDFELLKVLGTGTYGRVLSARGTDGKVYAIKIITKIGMDDTMRRNAKIERDMLREVRHPFVASLLFAFQNEDKVYMGMEFYNGGDLRHHLTMNQNNELKLTAGRIKLYAAELVAGLAHLHSLDIIYRDLKPENILIQKDGHIVLVDFGLSTYARHDENMKTHSLAGSPEYISPEVLAAANPKKGDPLALYDKTCDWWSLGILIFEMYVGRTPFKDDNKAIMYRNIAEGFLYIPPELPEDVQSLLAGLIERDPFKRLGANEAVPFTIMKHPFFKGIDWEKLQQKNIEPEWVPDVIDDADAKYVDNEFINQVPVDTPEWRMLDSVDREREYFEDFTYRATRSIQNSSENDAQERLLRAPLNSQNAAMGNTSGSGFIRQHGNNENTGFTSLSTLSAPTTYWQKMMRMEAATLMRYLRYANVVLAVLQALAGFMGLFNLMMLDITCFLISFYAVVFALLLLAFECRFKHMEPWIRQQFGFLFTYRGRTAFIFIVGFMDFGMEGSLPFFVGFLMCANAILSLVIMLFHPQFREGTLNMNMDPTATYRPAVEETETLLRQHEGVAAKAGAFVLHEAEEHPEFMAKMAQSYAAQHGYIPPAPL